MEPRIQHAKTQGSASMTMSPEDPAIPEMRHALTHGREKLIDLHKETQRYTGPLEPVEPDEEELAWVWEIVEREPS